MMATDMIVNFCKYKTALYKIFINEQLGLCAVSFKCCSVFLRLWVVAFESLKTKGAIHSTKIPTGPTGKSGPPQKVDPFFRNFSGWTEPIHWVLDRNFRKVWLNGSRPKEKISWAKSGRGPTSFPGFSPTRPTERTERTRLVAVCC